MINIFDLIILFVLVISFIVGFKKSALPELVSLVGMIVIFILSYTFKGYIGNILCDLLPFFKFSGNFEGITSLNILMYQGIGFFLIFSVLSSVLLVLLKLSGIVQKVINLTLVLWLPLKIVGGLISTLTSYLCIFVITITLMIPLHNFSIYTESEVVKAICFKTPILSSKSGGIIESFKEVYDLGDKVGKGKIDSKEANIELTKTMVKYKVIEEKELNKLIKNKKLDVNIGE